MKNKVNYSIGIFILIVILSGWIGVILDSVLISQSEGDSLGMGVWLVLPILAALIIILFSKGSRRGLGLKAT